MAVAASIIDLASHSSAVRARAAADAWASLPDAHRRIAQRRVIVVRWVAELAGVFDSLPRAAREAAEAIANRRAPSAVLDPIEVLAIKAPSARTLQRWTERWQRDGLQALAPRHHGRGRPARGWEARAEALYCQPTRPKVATVALWLAEEGFAGASYSRVYRYFRSLPMDRWQNNPARLGRHYYQQNHTPYIIRDNTVLAVGYQYEGDGHCCDVYVAHPVSGNPWRPELTFWLDKRSQYIVGWTLSRCESALATVESLGAAILRHDHVMAEIHVDPGPGFKNRILLGELTGLCERLGVTAVFALPGNARGKGLVEHEFAVFEERCGKRLPTYCGHCRTDDALSRFRDKVKRGEIALPSLAQYHDAIDSYVMQRNGERRKALGAAPAQLWHTLERRPLGADSGWLTHCREVRTVRNWRVTIDKRIYGADALRHVNTRKVVVEFSVSDDSVVKIRDIKGRWLCDAHLVHRKPGVDPSRIIEREKKAELAAIARKERDIEEIAARNRQLVDQSDLNTALDAIDPALPAPASPAPDDVSDDNILDYL